MCIVLAFSPPGPNLANLATSAIAAALVSTTITVATHPIPSYALGVNAGLLAECSPPRLSCISSQDDAPTSFLEPWQYDKAETSQEELQALLTNIVLSENGSRLVATRPRYACFEIANPITLGGGIDDVEFYFPNDDDIVHFRSAARGGRFEGWRNRRRMDSLRVRAGLTAVPVLRGRSSVLGIFESPFDSFGPSAVSPDAVIERGGIGSRPMR